MAKNRVTLINRKEYERIRKMDHRQVSEFVAGVYQEGYNDGKKERENFTEPEIRSAILSVKGIGEKKVNDIMQAIIVADKEKGNR